MAGLRAAHPGTAVAVWAEDEARLGLKPIARRVWGLKGRRPASKFESVYVFGFAHPATGRNRTLIPPKANTATMAPAPADSARRADPGGRKVLVLVVDNAGWHGAGTLAVPANVALHHPPCAPESQPAEPPWPLVREGVANKAFPTPAAPTDPPERRCRGPAGEPATVEGAVGFHWAVALG